MVNFDTKLVSINAHNINTFFNYVVCEKHYVANKQEVMSHKLLILCLQK